MTPMLTRRDLLRLGVWGGAGLLALPSLRTAVAATGARKLVIVVTHQGVPYDSWCMRPNGIDAGYAEGPGFVEALAGLPVSPVLAPLAPYFPRAVVVDGLAEVSVALDPNLLLHDVGRVHSLTGRPIQHRGGAYTSTGPSIDQVIAGALRTAGQIPSVALAVGSALPFTFADAALPITPLASEYDVQTALFSGSGATVSDGAAREAVLRADVGAYDALLARMPSDARARVEAQRDLLRDLADQTSGLPSCGRPDFASGPISPGDEAGYQNRIKAAVAILACGSTPVVTLTLDDMPASSLGESGMVHEMFAHFTRTDAHAHDVMTRFSTAQAQHVADLCAQLDAVPTASGTLLDETLVVWISELADGSHAVEGWPVILIGGPAIRGGRYVRLDPSTTFSATLNPGVPLLVGVPHQRLLTTIARAMGVEIDQFGLTAITDRRGIDIDATGWLPDVLA